MPPQQDNDATATTTSSNGNENPAPVTTTAGHEPSSYWEAPAEKELEGKRLSTMDLSSLEQQRAVTKNTTMTTAEQEEASALAVAGAGSSYWEAPAEKGLDGQRLSEMDLTSLAAQHLDAASASGGGTEEEQQRPADENNNSNNSTGLGKKRHSVGSYWEWQGDKIKTSLSKLSLTNLARSRGNGNGTQEEEDVDEGGGKEGQASSQEGGEPSPKRGGNYWEWQGAKFKHTLSNLSLSNLAKGSRGAQDSAGNADGGVDADDQAAAEAASGMGPRRPSKNSYWFWRNSSMKNLNSSNASLTALEHAAKEGDAAAAGSGADDMSKQQPGGNDGGGGGRSYWFWRNGSINDLTISSASLDTLDKKAKASESGKQVSISDDSAPSSGPITNLQHKMRNSWRKSFQHFSTNSLSKLDEGSTVDAQKKGWKEAFSGGKKKTLQLDNDDSLGGVSACSNGSFGDGAITF